MSIYNVDRESLHRFLEENKRVIIGVYEENCPVSSLFLGMMRQLRKNFDNSYLFLIMNKKEYMSYFNYKKVSIYPKIMVFENQKVVKTIEGFKNYRLVYEKIAA